MKNTIAFVALILLIGCKSTKNVSNATTADDISSAKLVTEYYANTLDYTAMEARTRVSYETNGKSQPTVTVTIRIEKDNTIWLNGSLLGITGARALITPESVKFYDKLNGQYFDGSFEFLSEYLGVEIDFDQLQRLLTGQTVYDLRKGRYTFTPEGNQYKVTPRIQNELLDLFFFINTSKFVVEEQQVLQKEDSRTLTVAYSNHQMVEGKPFPATIKILATEPERNTQIEIDFRGIEINGDVRFPFSIPSGYEEIKLNASN